MNPTRLMRMAAVVAWHLGQIMDRIAMTRLPVALKWNAVR
jgi:hypothetical protein